MSVQVGGSLDWRSLLIAHAFTRHKNYRYPHRLICAVLLRLYGLWINPRQLGVSLQNHISRALSLGCFMLGVQEKIIRRKSRVVEIIK